MNVRSTARLYSRQAFKKNHGPIPREIRGTASWMLIALVVTVSMPMYTFPNLGREQLPQTADGRAPLTSDPLGGLVQSNTELRRQCPVCVCKVGVHSRQTCRMADRQAAGSPVLESGECSGHDFQGISVVWGWGGPESSLHREPRWESWECACAGHRPPGTVPSPWRDCTAERGVADVGRRRRRKPSSSTPRRRWQQAEAGVSVYPTVLLSEQITTQAPCLFFPSNHQIGHNDSES